MNELRQMQLMLTDMLKVFHDFCIEHSLTYYVLFGTALGAARHQGFIPWDDDLDVGLPRPDYERLIEIFNKENKNARYLLESNYSTKDDFLYTYAKLYDTKTTLIEKINPPFKRGIFIDIFPIDGAGAQEEDSRELIKKINRLLFFRTVCITIFPKNRFSCRIFLMIILQIVLRVFYDSKNICKTVNDLCKAFDYNSSQYVTVYSCGVGLRALVEKKVLGTPKLVKFENIFVNCPEDIEVFLTHAYGDWRTPPPIEKQITHHLNFIDLTKSYLDAH